VHYYVKIGLLQKPRRVGLGVYLYDDSHLNTLRKIRRLRRSENLSLSDIKERLLAGLDEERPDLDKSTPVRGVEQSQAIRARILDTATQLFSKRGYESTRISDITDSLGMAKGSFYLHFEDKKELFVACIERLACIIVPEHTWEDIANEEDYTVRQTKRAVAFLKAFPSYAGILNLVKMAAMGEDPLLATKAKEAFARIVRPLVQDFRKAVGEGHVRDMDDQFFAYAVLGMAESLGYKLMTDPDTDLYICVERFVDLISRGVLPQTHAAPEASETRRPAGKITDVKGDTVEVREISFGGKPYLVGRLGEGEIRLDTEKIAFILLDNTGTGCVAQVTLRSGEKIGLDQDGNMIVSAASSAGLYTLPFHRLRSISFV
jgi:AcrR family transcriptional regulator